MKSLTKYENLIRHGILIVAIKLIISFHYESKWGTLHVKDPYNKWRNLRFFIDAMPIKRWFISNVHVFVDNFDLHYTSILTQWTLISFKIFQHPFR